MVKQLIVVAQDRSQIPQGLYEKLLGAGFLAVFCGCNATELSRVKYKSNLFLVFLPDDTTDVGEHLIYIRDTCIEEEKSMYVVGSQDARKAMSKYLPKMIVKRTFSNVETEASLKDMVDRISQDNPKNKHRNVLYLGMDAQFATDLRMMISEDNELAAVDGGYREALIFATDPNLVVVDMDMSYTVTDTVRLMGLIKRLSLNNSRILLISEDKITGKEALKLMGIDAVYLAKHEITPKLLANFIRK